MSSNTHSHWVEDLFPPLFDIQDEEDELPKTLCQKFDIHDVDALKNLYERVRVVFNDEQDKSVAELADGETKVASVVSQDESSKPVWTPDELEILREFTRNIVAENKQLKIQQQMIETENRDLKATNGDLRHRLNEMSEKLTAAVKANERLSIRVTTLERELKTSRDTNCSLKQNFDAVNEEKRVQNNQVSKLQQKYGKLKINTKRLVIEVKEFNVVLDNEKKLVQDRITNLYEKKIVELQNDLDKISAELESEKLKHDISKKGLDQLRLHFASLQMQDIDNSGEIKFSLT